MMKKFAVFFLLILLAVTPVFAEAATDHAAAIEYSCDTEQIIFTVREYDPESDVTVFFSDKNFPRGDYNPHNGHYYNMLDMEYEPDIRVVASSVLVYCGVTNGFETLTIQVDTKQDGEWKYAGAARVGAGEVLEIRFQKPCAYLISCLRPEYPEGKEWYIDPTGTEEKLYTLAVEDVYEWDIRDEWKDIYAAEMAKED